MCNCPDHYGSRIVIINLDFPLYPRMNERFKLHISSSVTVHQTQYFCRCYSKGSFHLNVYTFLTGRVSSRTQDQFKYKTKADIFCLVKQARHNNQMLTPFSLLSLWPNGQEDRQRFISLCHIVYLAACGTLNKWSVVGDVLSNHVPARRPEAKQVQNMILVALAPVHGLWIYIISIPDRKFWGKMCWKTEIYFGLTQELQPTSVSVLLLNDI